MTSALSVMVPDANLLHSRLRLLNQHSRIRSQRPDPFFLHRRVSTELAERMHWSGSISKRALDVAIAGAGSVGAVAYAPDSADVIHSDLCPSPERSPDTPPAGHLKMMAAPNALPLVDGSIDRLTANLVLHWYDPQDFFNTAHRVLAPGGIFGFSTLGPDTLVELRQAFASVNLHPHVHDFFDMHDLGDTLLAAGFVEPVLDVERIVLTYSDLSDLVQDLRALGATNTHPERSRGLLGQAARQRLVEAYEVFRGSDQRLPVTVEVIYGLAFAGKQAVSLLRREDGLSVNVE